MTRSKTEFLLHRASERVSAGAAALAVTFHTLLTVDTRACEPLVNPPSVSVCYSDVSFGYTAGAATVYRKLKAALHRLEKLSATALRQHAKLVQPDRRRT